jgi:hypothetical protein
MMTTNQTPWTDYHEIANEARRLQALYREQAETLEKRRAEIEEVRAGRNMWPEDALWGETLAALQNAHRIESANCGEYAQAVGRLALAVAGRLPDLFPQLKLIASARAWHTIQGFDWDAAEVELRQVQAAAQSAITHADERRGNPTSRIRRDEANLRARKALRGKPPGGKPAWTQRTLAHAIGCSPGLVTKLPAWQTYRQEHVPSGKKKAGGPRAVGLTASVLANEGQNDPELERLIAEQTADCKDSPLISNARKHRRRRMV